MIYFVLARSNSSTIKNYLEFRGAPLAGTVDIVYYDSLSVLKNLNCSTLIFSDFDRLTDSQLNEVKKIYNQLKQKYPELKLINNPSKIKLRYNFLRQLFELGINPYNVFRLTEPLGEMRFPVFLREENNHTGALSDLIYNRKSLEKNVLALNLQAYPTKNLLAVEFVNVANNEGIFKKYSALKVDKVIYPRQLDYNMHWMVKTSVLFNSYPEQEYLQAFTTYMNENPHEKWLNKIFEIAEIEYGRIDYGVFNEKPIVWEINLNPDYGGRKSKERKKRNPVVNEIRNRFHEKMRERIFELDRSENVKVELNISGKIMKILNPKRGVEFWRNLHNKLTTKKPKLKKMVQVMRKCFLAIATVLLFILKPLKYSPLKKQ